MVYKKKIPESLFCSHIIDGMGSTFSEKPYRMEAFQRLARTKRWSGKTGQAIIMLSNPLRDLGKTGTEHLASRKKVSVPYFSSNVQNDDVHP